MFALSSSKVLFYDLHVVDRLSDKVRRKVTQTNRQSKNSGLSQIYCKTQYITVT